MSQSKQAEHENDHPNVAIQISACKMNETSEDTVHIGSSMRSMAAVNDTKNLLQSNASKNIAAQGRAGMLRVTSEQTRKLHQNSNTRVFNSATAMNDY